MTAARREPPYEIEPRDRFLDRRWDVLVVGAGMAGATFGYEAARRGQKVLFCEMGNSQLAAPERYLGVYAETLFERRETPQLIHRDILSRAGRYFGEVVDLSGRRVRRHIPFIGSGTGGSSALYGGALERFFPEDFEPLVQHPDAGESTIPERWPISYSELEPYYEKAERLYRVRGSPDPLRSGGQQGSYLDPPPLSESGRELFEFFAGKGLNPYRLPQACEFVEGCEGCQGFLCPRDCKNDSSRICLKPALDSYGAALLDRCEVLRLEATRDSVTGVVCQHGDQEITLRAGLVVLAAGALETPGILLRSDSPDWPAGLANGSGQVGKNLMRHYVDLYAVRPRVKRGLPGNQKELAFNDFYCAAEEKLGTVQSFGELPPRDVVLAELAKSVSDSGWSWLAPSLPLAHPLVKPILAGLRRRVVLASIMEDLPFADNRVTLPPDADARVAVRYRIHELEHRRIERFRSKLRDTLRPYRFELLKQAENNQRIAHACGTCRAGDEADTSVLDRWNRAHELRNLYVLDSSFFPTSGGTNPALTIAANALRVADHIFDRAEARADGESTDEHESRRAP